MLGKRGATPRTARRYSAYQDAARHCDLPKTLRQELREHYPVPRDLPHQMFALLMSLNDHLNQMGLNNYVNQRRARHGRRPAS